MQFFRVHHERIVMVGHGREWGGSKKESGSVADISERIDIGDFGRLLKSSLEELAGSKFEIESHSARGANNSQG